MKEYTVIYSNNIVNLEYQVNEFMEDGWNPLGGVSVVRTNTGSMLYQAMLREVQDD